MRPFLFAILVPLAACSVAPVEFSVCENLCTTLVGTCGFDAFPTFDSCMQGCGADAEEGVDLQGKLDCIQNTSCDTFDILECENQFNLE